MILAPGAGVPPIVDAGSTLMPSDGDALVDSQEQPPDLARRYFRFLGIDDRGADWCRVNRELAARVGLLDGARPRRR